MASFDAINYSLRPSKSIQRQLAFDGIRLLQASLDLSRMVYIGFGSIWFTDFSLAHRTLGVDEMISIEADEVGFERARFNAPYSTVDVRHGLSSDVLPALYLDAALSGRPWLVWLDFDYDFNEAAQQDLRSLIEKCPANSVVLATFNAQEMRYGEAKDRVVRLQTLFGSVVPDDLSKRGLKADRLQSLLADLALDFLKSTAAEMSRPGGFVPSFRMLYKDSAPMVTVGGVLPSRGAVRVVEDLVRGPAWPCTPPKPIIAPHLTLREAMALQSRLPRPEGLTREDVRALGFDLEPEQIEAFETYYRQFPTFAQIVA